jgi:hypothetical protein
MERSLRDVDLPLGALTRRALGLGRQQHLFLAVLRMLETEHGEDQWFHVHCILQAVRPLDAGAKDARRAARAIEAVLNSSRILATLASRGLIVSPVVV